MGSLNRGGCGKESLREEPSREAERHPKPPLDTLAFVEYFIPSRFACHESINEMSLPWLREGPEYVLARDRQRPQMMQRIKI